MKKFQKVAVALALPMCVLAASPARAGIPVLDAGNLIQNVMDVLNSITQIENQIEQITTMGQQVSQMGEQLEAIKGIRGLANFANNPMLRDYVPANAAGMLRNVSNNGYAGLDGAAKAMRDARMLYNCEDVNNLVAKNECTAKFAAPYQQKAMFSQALETAGGRSSQIQQLMSSAASAADPKAIAEATARLTGETAMIQQEQTRATLLLGMTQAEDRAAESERVERSKANSRRTGNLADFFE